MQDFSFHTIACGDLRLHNVGETVVLTGWVQKRRDLGEHVFIDVRDRSGLVQVSVDSTTPDAFAVAKQVRSEWVVLIEGVVEKKLEPNPKLKTGEVEVKAQVIKVLNTSNTPPFQMDNTDISEDIRLRYRYLDLRKPEMQNNLRLRSDFSFAIRKALHKRLFTEVETPALFKSTPEGARDFLVPSRTQPGCFYALPQSPQLLKQLLMVGGVEKYYQIVKCFRDEDLRADRQPEFTQVDIEMSFVDMDGAISELEQVLAHALGEVGVSMPTPLRRLNYWDAMDTYGSDKPDTRFEMHLHDVTDVFANTEFKVFAQAVQTPGHTIKLINAQGAGDMPRSQVDKLAEIAKQWDAKGLAWLAQKSDGKIVGSIAKFVGEAELEALSQNVGFKPGSLLLFAVGERMECNEILGGMRLHMADLLGIERVGHDFLWVVNFPMFKYDKETDRYVAEHHPFTLPACEDFSEIDSNPLGVGSFTYDFVMDGYEAGGGGLRIYKYEDQIQILNRMGFSEEQAQEQFGFLLEALSFGAPPMGGFALGLDRVCMLLCGCDSLRDVMAFPKTTSGSDLMSECPSAVSEAQLEELSLQLRSE